MLQFLLIPIVLWWLYRRWVNKNAVLFWVWDDGCDNMDNRVQINLDDVSFPKDFLWGVATAAHVRVKTFQRRRPFSAFSNFQNSNFSIRTITKWSLKYLFSVHYFIGATGPDFTLPSPFAYYVLVAAANRRRYYEQQLVPMGEPPCASRHRQIHHSQR
jgi:hypothetical protein